MSAEKTWEEEIHEASRLADAGALPADAVLLRAALGRELECAHLRALGQARQLVVEVQRVVRKLAEDGIGAPVSGNNYLGEAQSLRERVVELEAARAAFGLALRMGRSHGSSAVSGSR